jgi:hypothetical protein
MKNIETPKLRRVMGLPQATAMVAGTIIGSDYPHQIGSLEKMVDSIDKLNISSKDKEAIYGENSIKLLEIIQ